MGLFGKKDQSTAVENANAAQQDEMTAQRIAELERRIANLSEKIEDLGNRLSQLEEKETQPAQTANATPEDSAPVADVATTTQRHLFLPAPSADGIFEFGASQEQIGKSIYSLSTDDLHTATFRVIDSRDAIATSMISVSQLLKPACKILGNTAMRPQHIVTEEEGKAVRDGNGWRVIQKAIIRFC